MNWIVANIKPIMLVSGTLTFTMIVAALSPQAALRSSFGETLDGPLADLIVRNWGALIALVGGMLIYGAFHPPSRPMALSVAALKLTFIALVLSNGQRFLGHQAGLAVVVDTLMVVVFGLYLARTRGE